MHELLDAVKIGVSLFFLSFASWQDFKTREISNKIWVLFAPLGLTITLFQVVITQQPSRFLTLAVSVLVVSGLSVTLFYLGFFGGADAKAFICLSVTLPAGPIFFQNSLKTVSYLFSLSIFDDAVLISALTAVGLVVYNLLWRIKTGETLFNGLETESPWKKLLALITGYKIELSKLGKTSHLVPIEELSAGEDGRVKRRLKVLVKADEDDETWMNRVQFSEKQEIKLWVTPNLPFIIFITIGLVVTLLVGDAILWLATKLIRF